MSITNKTCFCGKPYTFEACCHPIISGDLVALNAEQLMRSRFSAYCIKDYHYILHSYAAKQRAKLSVQALADSAENTQWLSLKVLTHTTHANTAQVEFKATYQIDRHFFVMHELSDFILEGDKWFYTTGVIQKDSGELTPQRNSPCLCASGKKFKKCCGQ